MFANLIQDIKYTIKLVRGIASGYDGLQVQFCGEWEYVPHRLTSERDRRGKLSGEYKFDMPDNPHWICATWNNGSHLPLPLVLNANGEYPIQNALIKLLHKAYPYPNRWHEAVRDCATYENQWFRAEDRLRSAAGETDGREYFGEETLEKLRAGTLEFERNR